MAEREVTLKILVDDKDAAGKIERLKKATESIGGARVTGLTQVEKGSTAAGQAINDLTSRIAIMGGGLSGIGGPAAIAIGAIVGVTAAAVALSQKIFDLAKVFVDYAKSVGEARDRTGVSIAILSALKFSVESTGKSFGAAVRNIQEFEKTIAAANNGSKEASAKLNRLGIDGKAAAENIDEAFRQAIAKIASLPEGVQRAAAATDAFGESGTQLIPLIKEIGGNVDELVKRAAELGVALSGEDVRAAAEFERSLNQIKSVATAVGIAFGRELADPVKQALDDINGGIREHRGEIKEWAEFVGNTIRSLLLDIEQLINGFKTLGALSTGLNPYRIDGAAGALPELLRQAEKEQIRIQIARSQIGKPNYTNAQPDDYADYQAGRLPLASPPYNDSGPVKPPKSPLPKLTDEQKQAQELAKIIKDLALQIQFFGDKSEEAAMKQRLMGMGVKDVTTGLAGQAVALAKQIDGLKAAADAEKKRADAKQQFLRALNGISNAEYLNRVNIAEQINLTNKQIEVGRDLTGVEQQQIANQAELLKKTQEWSLAGFGDFKIKELIAKLLKEQEETLKRIITLDAARAKLAADIADKQKQEKLKQQYEDLRQSLQDQIDLLSRGGRPLTVYEQTVRSLTREYKDLSDEQKSNLLVLAQQADAVGELNKQHAELKDFFKETFRYVFEGDFKGLFENLQRRLKEQLADKLSDFLATTILGFDPNATNNPVAKPIVGKIDQTNRILSAILGRLGGTPLAGGLGSLNLGSLLGGNAGGGIFNFGGAGSAAPAGTIWGTGQSGLPILIPNGQPTNPGGILSQIFGRGGIFGQQGFGNNVGTYQGIGALGGMLGGAIGGRIGGVISGAASGLALGAQIGSIIPGIGTAIGAVVGAIAGGLIGLFGGDPKRKRDKNEKVPQLNKGFADALAELTGILADIRSLRIDPDEAVKRAADVRAQIASGFGVQFESKKYKKIAQQQIAAKLTQADSIIEQIKAAAEIARGAADRSKRILPEFAGGGYFADFYRPSGLVPGMFDGRDNILAMISSGEMVLNPAQQNRVRGIAGGDVFAGAGIPNYPKASSSPKLAMGGIAGAGLSLATPPPVIQQNFTFIAEGVTFDDKAKIWVQTDDGKRALVKMIINEKKTNSKL